MITAAAAVIAIVVAYFTAGAGSGLVGTTTTAASGATTTAIGTTTLVTTTAAGVTTTYTAGAIVNAGVSALASKAAVSLINNRGDLGATFKELGSKDNLRQLALSMVTAGALNSLGNSLTIDGVPLNKITAEHSFAANVGKNLINGLTRATINSAVTGTDLETSLRTEIVASLLNAASAKGAKWVGDQAQTNTINEFGRAVAHAVVGCVSGAAGSSASNSGISGGSACGAGALGAVVGELSAGLYNNGRAEASLLPESDTVQFASMMSGIAAAVAGQDAQGVAIAASTGANAAENNWLNHADAEQLKLLKQKRLAGQCSTQCEQEIAGLELLDKLNNRLLLNACVNGTQAECTAQLNRDPAAKAYAYQHISKIAWGRVLSQAGNNASNALSSLGTKEQLTQLVLEVMPLVGSAESAAQLITGKQSLTGEEASRFWAAVGLVPVAGGIIHRVGNTTADVAQALQAADKVADTAKQQGLINDANRLFKQYVDDIETQTGYRLNGAQRTALANEMRTGNHAVTLSPAENAVLRNQFNSQRPALIAEWEKQTGQRWPSAVVDGINIPAQAHHVIPVTNAGPTVWWNITPAMKPAHQAIHSPASPLKQLQKTVK